MSKVFVMFGSKSDEPIYNKVLDILNKDSIPHELHICSAHRTPERVAEILSDEHALVVSGAGLAAALPGVVAAHTIRPVIGVPCKNNYLGLDSLLSIAQMPPGVPVLAVGVEQAEIAANNAVLMLKDYTSVNIVFDEKTKTVEKAISVLDEFGVDYKESDSIDPERVNISFVYFDEPMEQRDELVIYCPLLLKNDDKAEAAINFLNHSTHGMWVGLNRGENAALAAIEILSVNGKFDDKLKKFRSEQKQKVIDANKK